MRLLLFTLSFVLTSAMLSAQEIETDKAAKDAIKRFAFIIGDWKGDGWMMGQDRQKHTFSQVESIRFKLDSTAVLIEGIGRNSEKIIHNALAILRYDKQSNQYLFHSYLANGKEGKFKAELKDNKMYWFPNERMRYTIYINDKNQWYELGEMKQGDKWFQFFEMTLNRQ